MFSLVIPPSLISAVPMFHREPASQAAAISRGGSRRINPADDFADFRQLLSKCR